MLRNKKKKNPDLLGGPAYGLAPLGSSVFSPSFLFSFFSFFSSSFFLFFFFFLSFSFFFFLFLFETFFAKLWWKCGPHLFISGLVLGLAAAGGRHAMTSVGLCARGRTNVLLVRLRAKAHFEIPHFLFLRVDSQSDSTE